MDNITSWEIIRVFIVVILISLVDFITLFRARRKNIQSISHAYPRSDDFTILVPIFGNMRYLRNIEFLKQYARQVVLCTTTKEGKEFDTQIKTVAHQYGFRIYRSEVPLAAKQQKPNPWKLFTSTLHGKISKDTDSKDTDYQINSDIVRDEIIRDSFEIVTTNYCIFLDGDTTADQDLGQLTQYIFDNNYDICSVRVLSSKEKTIMEKLQSVEYRLAMDARKIYPWLTSGASMVAKTSVIKNIMGHHSLFFSGGDIEIGKLAKLLNYNVGHAHFIFFTDVPETFKAWFKQRLAWSGGGFRHAVINFHRYSWRHPLFYFYFTFLVYLGTPIRLYEAIKNPWMVLIIIPLYWMLIYIFHWEERRWFYLLFPIYALIQIIVIIPLGIYTYFKMAYHAQNIGHIKLRFQHYEYIQKKSWPLSFNDAFYRKLYCVAFGKVRNFINIYFF